MIGHIGAALAARLRKPLHMLLEPSSWAGIAGAAAGLAQFNTYMVWVSFAAGAIAVLLKGSSVQVPAS